MFSLLLLSFLFGISVSQFIPVYVIYGLYAGILVSVLYLFWKSRKSEVNNPPIGGSKIIVMACIGLTIGILVFKHAENNISYLPKDSIGVNVSTEAIILDIPVSGNYNYSAKAKIDDKYVLLRYKDADLKYGDKVSIDGKFEIPEAFDNDYGVTFDYPKYLQAKGINYIFEAKRVEKIGEHHAPLIREWLYKLRIRMTDTINNLLHNPHAGLVNGVLIGEKSGLGKELKDAMARVGVIHIAVLSGYNIMVVAMGLFYFLSKFTYRHSWKVAGVVSVISIFAIVLMSGAEPPSIRAGLLGLVVVLGKVIVHRQMHVGRALLLIASIIVLFNPFSLLYDVSFQLSFIATLGLVYIAPIISKYLKFITEKLGLREIVATTIGAQIAVTPLLLHTTGIFSIVSLPANILILPTIPFLMGFGFLVSVLGNIWQILAYPFVWFCHLLSAYAIYIVNLFDRIPVSQLRIESVWGVISIYILILSIFLYIDIRNKKTLMAVKL